MLQQEFTNKERLPFKRGQMTGVRGQGSGKYVDPYFLLAFIPN
jgi:hypothetical protein